MPVVEFNVMPSSLDVVEVVTSFLVATDCKSVPSLVASELLVELLKVDINDTFRFDFNFAEVLDTTEFEDVRSILSGADFEVVCEVPLSLLVTEFEVVPSLAVSEREEGALLTIEPRVRRLCFDIIELF